MNAPLYRVDFSIDDRDPLQRLLNELYEYGDDVTTKVLHRARLNLFWLLASDLIDRGVIARRGGAAGIYSRLISDLGFSSVLGIDVNAAAVERAREHFGAADGRRTISFDVADAEMFDVAGAFDLVLCTEVLEHVRDPERVVGNIARALAPGGVAIVSLPNAISLPYLAAWISRRRRGRALEPELREHLRYPFARALARFTHPDLERVATDGTNLVLDPRTLRLLYGKAIFARANELNFRLARIWPLKYVSQFFFIVLRRPAARADGGARRPAPS